MKKLIIITLTTLLLFKTASLSASFINPQDMPSTSVMKAAHQGYSVAEKKHITHTPIMLVVDFSKPSSEKRLWMIDMDHDTVLMHTYVAHGSGSGANTVTKLSNKPQSNASSIGFFLTGQHYVGKHGKSVRLQGLESGFNDHAATRGIVIHSAPYISKATIKALHRLGRSWGCFALNNKDLKEVLKSSHEPVLLMAYYPDSHWTHSSHYLNG